MGSPDWAMTDELAVLTGRQAREGEIDALVEAWTRQHTVAEVVEACLPSDGGADAQLRRTVRRPALPGPWLHRRTRPTTDRRHDLRGPGFHATGMPVADIRPAPGLGAHTRDVCAELGLDDAEIDSLLASGAIELDVASGA